MELSIADFLSLKKSIIKKGVETKIRILTKSMEPFIYANEEVYIKSSSIEKVKRFTPIVFWYKNELVCHFYIKKVMKNNEIFLLTKGLVSKVYDDPIRVDHFLGEVTSPRINIIRKFALWCSTLMIKE